jgi:NAD(P)H-dependent FMN reductase
MPSQLKFVGLGGSFRPNSSSATVMQIVLQQLSERGYRTASLLLADLRLPPYEAYEKLSDYPTSVHWFLQQIRSADGLIFSTPVHLGALSGAMKNALDYLEYLAEDSPPYLTRKVVGLISTSRGIQGTSAINTLDYICRALHAWVCPTTVAVTQSHEQFDANGNLKNEVLRRRLSRLTDELEFAVVRFRA